MLESTFPFELNDDNFDLVDEQLTEENRILNIDFYELNPQFAERVRGGYEINVYTVNIEGITVYLVYFDDGFEGSAEDFDDRMLYFTERSDAMAAVGEDYNRLLNAFTE